MFYFISDKYYKCMEIDQLNMLLIICYIIICKCFATCFTWMKYIRMSVYVNQLDVRFECPVLGFSGLRICFYFHHLLYHLHVVREDTLVFIGFCFRRRIHFGRIPTQRS